MCVVIKTKLSRSVMYMWLKVGYSPACILSMLRLGGNPEEEEK